MDLFSHLKAPKWQKKNKIIIYIYIYIYIYISRSFFLVNESFYLYNYLEFQEILVIFHANETINKFYNSSLGL